MASLNSDRAISYSGLAWVHSLQDTDDVRNRLLLYMLLEIQPLCGLVQMVIVQLRRPD